MTIGTLDEVPFQRFSGLKSSLLPALHTMKLNNEVLDVCEKDGG